MFHCLTFSCRCFTLHVSAYMAIFKCVGRFYFHIPEGNCFAGFTCTFSSVGWVKSEVLFRYYGVLLFIIIMLFCTVMVCMSLFVLFCSVLLNMFLRTSEVKRKPFFNWPIAGYSGCKPSSRTFNRKRQNYAYFVQWEVSWSSQSTRICAVGNLNAASVSVCPLRF
jgi:hypothetical protein